MIKITLTVLSLLTQTFAQDVHNYSIVEISVEESDSAYNLSGSYPKIEGLKDTVIQIQCNARIRFLIDD